MTTDEPYEPGTTCGATWEFDTSFDVTCILRADHYGRHHAEMPGNGGITAAISWTKWGNR